MDHILTLDQIQRYRREGFLHVPAFLTPDEVATLKRAVLEAVEQMGDQRLAGTREQRIKDDTYYDSVFTQRLNLWRLSPIVRRFLQGPEIGAMVCDLEEVERMRIWLDQALIKEPFANPTAWHLDNPYWSFHSRHAISIWIALEDATVHNGCMYFIPGSHRMARFDNVGIGQQLNALFDIYPEMTNTDPVAVPMKAGDCSFHNGLTAHAAGPNMTRGRRIAMTAAYMPDASTFNGQQDILPSAYASSLRLGDMLDNEELNPLVGQASAKVTPT